MTDRKRTDFQHRNVLKLGLTGLAITQLVPSAYDGRGNKCILRGATVEDLPAINAVVTAAVRAWDSSERVVRLALTSLLYRESDFAHMAAVVAEDRTEAVAVATWEITGRHRHAGRTLCAPDTRHLRRARATKRRIRPAPVMVYATREAAA